MPVEITATLSSTTMNFACWYVNCGELHFACTPAAVSASKYFWLTDCRTVSKIIAHVDAALRRLLERGQDAAVAHLVDLDVDRVLRGGERIEIRLLAGLGRAATATGIGARIGRAAEVGLGVGRWRIGARVGRDVGRGRAGAGGDNERETSGTTSGDRRRMAPGSRARPELIPTIPAIS